MLLQNCPLCSRQYDVAHLDPGQRIRCVCDVEFTVERGSDLRVEGMRCSNCGGPAAADRDECAYCGAALDAGQRGSIPCPSCFARIEDGSAHCPGCGVAVAPQALPPIPAGKDCPRCAGKLQIRSLESVSVVECAGCHGMWLDPKHFKGVCRDAQRDAGPSFGGDGSAPETPPAGVSTLAYIPCLDCGELMLRRQFRHRSRPTGVVIDFCRDHGVWLDSNELETVLRAIRSGAGDAPDVELIEEALRPRREVRTFPEGYTPPARERVSLTDVLGAIVDLFV